MVLTGHSKTVWMRFWAALIPATGFTAARRTGAAPPRAQRAGTAAQRSARGPFPGWRSQLADSRKKTTSQEFSNKSPTHSYRILVQFPTLWYGLCVYVSMDAQTPVTPRLCADARGRARSARGSGTPDPVFSLRLQSRSSSTSSETVG